MSKLDDGHDEILVPVSHRTADLERQMKLIVEGLQIEYAGRANALINVCSDSRFIAAKRNLYQLEGREKGDQILSRIFGP